MTINEHVSEILDECVDPDHGTCETYQEVKAWLTKKVEDICQEIREACAKAFEENANSDDIFEYAEWHKEIKQAILNAGKEE